VTDARIGPDLRPWRMIWQWAAVPRLNAFGEWLSPQSRKVLPNGPVGKAISCAQSKQAALSPHHEHGEQSIDNALPGGRSYLQCISLPFKRVMVSMEGIARRLDVRYPEAHTAATYGELTSMTMYRVRRAIPAVGSKFCVEE
jgi:hypothetical protein